MSPSLLANVGVLCMSGDDVGWAMMVATWVERHGEGDRDLLRTLCDQYMQKVTSYVDDSTRPPVLPPGGTTKTRHRRVIWQSQEAMINTFMNLFDVSICI